MHGLARFAGEVQQSLRIAEHDLAGGRQMQPLALADEQRDAELLLQLLDSGGHVGLDAVEFLGGAGDPAGLDDGAEHLKIRQLHHSLYEINFIMIIHFTGLNQNSKARH